MAMSRLGRSAGTEHEERAQPIPKRPNRSSHPLSSGQRRVWFFEELAPGVPLYNESETVRLVGELDPGAIEQALNLIVARHEMLRTTIEAGEKARSRWSMRAGR